MTLDGPKKKDKNLETSKVEFLGYISPKYIIKQRN